MDEPETNGELALIKAFRNGDPEALETLLDRHVDVLRERVSRQIPANLSRRVSAADILQDVRLVIFERCREFRGETYKEFQQWAIGIAKNHVMKAWQHHGSAGRRSVRREVSRDTHDVRGDAARGCASPSQEAVGRETRDLARRALDELHADHREVLRLVRFEGLTLKDAAARMGRSYDATYKLHARALFKLSEVYERLQPEDS